MNAESRKTGIRILGDVPWGTHGCLFYETQRDLLEVLIPFIAAGLESNEACLWVLPEPFSFPETLAQLRQLVPDVDQHLSERRLEVISQAQWHLEAGAAHHGDHLQCFRAKLESALQRGFAGLRATGDAVRFGTRYRQQAPAYEQALQSAVATLPALVFCSYPLEGASVLELLDASASHCVTAIVRQGAMQLLETPGRRPAHGMAGARFADPIRILRAENELLIKEILERKGVEQELRKQKEILQTIFDHIPVMINFFHGDRILLVNREWERVLGWTLEEIRESVAKVLPELYPDPADQERVLDFMSSSSGQWADFRTRVRDGRVMDTTWAVIHLSDGTNLGIGRDITEWKKAEEGVKAYAERLRALSASMEETREEERTHVARMVHDELGSVLTSLKWDLSGLEQMVPEPADPTVLSAFRAKVAAMLKLVDATIESVRTIASELRPSILDDLGLVEAIEWQTQQFEARTGIVCHRSGFSNHLLFSKQESTAIFRIFQESLTNILRHASATQVEITMNREGSEFVLTIRDNGRGIVGIEKSGLGILGMQERARLIGGKMEISGAEGTGTTISVRIPIKG